MEDITVDALKLRIDSNEKIHLVDVREDYEFEEFNLGAQLIPLGELSDRLDEIISFKDQELIVHCRSGARSGRAKEYLESEGFTKVRNLIGGIVAWQAAGY